MDDTTATVSCIITFLIVFGAIMGFCIQSSIHKGDNTHKTSIECIKAGNEWKKIYVPNSRSTSWACVQPE